jgi:hypothetical protein
VTIGFDLAVWDRKCAGEPNGAAVVQVGKCFPDPEKMLSKDRFVFKGFDLDDLALLRLFFLNPPQPLLVLGGAAAGPVQEGD